MEPIDPQKLITSTANLSSTLVGQPNPHFGDPRSPTDTVLSGDAPASSMGTSRDEEDDSSNQNSSDGKSSGNR